MLSYLRPLWQEERSMRHQLSQLQSELVSLQGNPDKGKAVEQHTDGLLKQVPPQMDTAGVITELLRLADQSGLYFTVITQGESVTMQVQGAQGSISDVEKGTFELTMLGHLPAFVQYLHELHEANRLVGVNRWNYRKLERSELSSGQAAQFAGNNLPVYSLSIYVDAYAAAEFQRSAESDSSSGYDGQEALERLKKRYPALELEPVIKLSS